MSTLPLDEAAIFNSARRIEDAELRRRFLDEACARNRQMRGRVEALLRIHNEEPTLLISPTDVVRPASSGPVGEGPGTQVGPYQLLELIGEGGMGTVYLAEQVEPIQRRVAVKIVRPGMNSREVLARFEAERRALALMEHPNIARVLDAGTTPAGRPYFVMELIGGMPITQFCDGKRLSLRERLELFVPVCRAVQHAHMKGIIHRDLKPSNVIVGEYDGKATPKVIDFGIAKATSVKLTERTLATEVGSVVGTLEYMSPEQAVPDELDIDTRADVYSLGVLLYELLTGTTPVQSERAREAPLYELLRSIREIEAPKPSIRLGAVENLQAIAANRGVEPRRLAGLVRGELDWIALKCLEKTRSRRYETANALARDIERFLNEEPVEACPPSAGYRLRKFARKNRRLLLGAGAFVALLTAGVVISTREAVRATAAEQRAVTAHEGETRQRQQAEQSAAESAAVLKFFRDRVLAAARPKGQDGGLGRDATIRAALDQAEPEIASAFADQPRVEASIRHALAESYSRLGLLDAAVRQQERTLALCQRALGSDHEDTLGAMNNLAIMRQAQGQSEAARQLLQEVVRLKRLKLGPEDPGTLRSINNLANILWATDQHAEARRLFEEVLPIQRRVQGTDAPDTLRTMNNLAMTLRAEGQTEAARTLFAEMLRIQRPKVSREHPQALATMNNLALLLEDEGQENKARALYEETLAQQRDILSTEHPDTLTTMHNLAELLVNQGHSKEARKLFEEALEVKRRMLRAGHPETLRTMDCLAWLLATASDVEVCNPRRALELAKEQVQYASGPGSRWTTLGVAYYRAGDWKGAVAALEKNAQLDRGKFAGLNNYYLAMAQWQLGEKDSARERFRIAAQWWKTNQSADPDVGRARTEALQLLGISDHSHRN